MVLGDDLSDIDAFEAVIAARDDGRHRGRRHRGGPRPVAPAAGDPRPCRPAWVGPARVVPGRSPPSRGGSRREGAERLGPGDPRDGAGGRVDDLQQRLREEADRIVKAVAAASPLQSSAPWRIDGASLAGSRMYM